MDPRASSIDSLQALLCQQHAATASYKLLLHPTSTTRYICFIYAAGWKRNSSSDHWCPCFAGLVSDAFHLTFGCGLLTFSLFAMAASRTKPDNLYTYGSVSSFPVLFIRALIHTHLLLLAFFQVQEIGGSGCLYKCCKLPKPSILWIRVHTVVWNALILLIISSSPTFKFMLNICSMIELKFIHGLHLHLIIMCTVPTTCRKQKFNTLFMCLHMV